MHALAQDRVGLPSFGRVADELGELGLHGGYTFAVTAGLFWLLVIAIGAGLAMWLWRAQRQLGERRAAEEARMASFVAQALPRAGTAPAPEEKLLFEAAGKTADAGEAALAIQLYARLIARFPQGALAAQARTAVEQQKKKLAIPTGPETAARG
jgi:hypothetical protein